MLFSTSIPDKLQEHSNTLAFMNVLDGLHYYRVGVISDALRVYNGAILTDKKWVLKLLDDFGVADIPFGYPLAPLIQYLLNVDTICGTRGSKIGVELYCSVLSLGHVTIDDTNFKTESNLLFLDSIRSGFLTDDNSEKLFYICSDSDSINPKESLRITIESKYFNGDYPTEEDLIKRYLETSIKEQIKFSPRGTVEFIYVPKEDFYHHELLNTYFV